MSNLYDLSKSYEEVLNAEIDAETMKDTLECIKEDITTKVENIAKLIKNIDADIIGIKSEEERLENKRKALENKKDSIKSYLEVCLSFIPDKKVKTSLFTIAMQKNAPSLNIIEETNIPKNYYIAQEPKLDKKSLLDALKSGQEIKGVEIKQTESVRIR